MTFGRVTSDGDPLPRALVYAADPESDRIVDATLTDLMGQYELDFTGEKTIHCTVDFEYVDLRPPYGKHPIGSPMR